MQMGLFSSRPILRTTLRATAICSCEPCEKLRRATSRPARTSWRKTSSLLEVGPRVATIFARRAGAVLRPLAPLWFVFILAILATTGNAVNRLSSVVYYREPFYLSDNTMWIYG